MTNPNPMYLEKPFSLAHARSMFGGSDPVKLSLLMSLLKHDYGYFEDEFQGTLNADIWTAAVTAGGGPTAFAYSPVRGGVLQGLTGATDNDGVALHFSNIHFDPNDNPFMLIQWQTNIVTGFGFEIGFSDAKTDESLPGVTDVDTPTIGNGATDILCVHMDTDQTLTTAELVGDGTTGSASVSTGPSLNTAAYTPSTSTWQTFLIGVRDNLGYVSIWNGNAFVGRFSVANAPDGGVLVRPYASFRTRNTTSKTINIRKVVLGWEQDF